MAKNTNALRLISILISFITINGYCQKPTVVGPQGHTDRVVGLVSSGDGRYLVSAGKDNRLIVWDVKNNRILENIESPKNLDYSVNSNASVVAFSDGNWNITLWNPLSNEKFWTFKEEGAFQTSLCNSKPWIAFGSYASGIKIANYETKTVIKTIPYSDRKSKLQFDNKGSILIVADENAKVTAWSVETGTMIWSRDLDELYEDKSSREISNMAISADDHFLYVTTNNKPFCPKKGQFSIFDMSTGLTVGTKDFESNIDCFSITPDGLNTALVISGGIKVYNTNDFSVVSEKLVDSKFHIQSVCYVLNGLALVTNEMILYDGKSCQKIRGMLTTNQVISIACHPKLPVLAYVDRRRNLTTIDLETGQLGRYQKGIDNSLLPNTTGIQFDATGDRIVIGSNFDYYFTLWDYKKWALIKNQRTTEYPQMVKFTPDGQKIICGGKGDFEIFSADNCTKLSNVSDYNSHEDFNIDPTGRFLITAGHTGVIGYGTNSTGIYNIQTGSKEKEISNELITQCKFSPDGKYALTAVNGEIVTSSPESSWTVLDGSTFEKVKTFIEVSAVGVFEYNHSGSVLAMGVGENIVLRDAKTFEKIATLVGHKQRVDDIDFTFDDRLLISKEADGQIKIWNWKEKTEVASIFNIDRNDFVIITPDNYYMSSKEGVRNLSFRLDKKLYPFDQFDIRYNRPDIVLSRIGYADNKIVNTYYQTYLMRIKRLGFTADMFDKEISLPEIVAKCEDDSLLTRRKMVQFSVQATDKVNTLDRLMVYVNDIPLYGLKGKAIKSGSRAYQENINLELTPGSNRISISVINSKGMESLSETFDRTYNIPFKPDLYLAVVGVSEYNEPDMNLQYATKDAQDLSKAIEAKKEEFANIHIVRLYNKDAVKEKMTGLHDFFNQSKAGDRAILFLAGHGILDENSKWYYAPSDMVFANPMARGFSYDDIERVMDGIAARQKLIFMDACNSGEVDKNQNVQTETTVATNAKVKTRGFKQKNQNKTSSLGLTGSVSLMNSVFNDLQKGTGITVIASAGGAEYAYESDVWKNGVFTFSVLEAIRTAQADLDNNGDVTVSELRDYVSGRVWELTNGLQRPVARKENINNFVIFKPLSIIKEPINSFLSIAFADGEKMATLEKSQLTYYTIADLKPAETVSLPVFDFDLGDGVVSPNNDLLVKYCVDKIMLFDLGTKRVVFQDQVSKKNGTIDFCRFSPDGKFFATIHSNHTVNIWDIEKKKIIKSFRPFKESEWVNDVFFNDNSTELWVFSTDGYAQIDAKSALEKNYFSCRPLIHYAFKGGFCFIESTTNSLQFHYFSGHPDFTLKEVTDNYTINSEASLAAVETDKKINIWDLESQKMIHSIDIEGSVSKMNLVGQKLIYSDDSGSFSCDLSSLYLK